MAGTGSSSFDDDDGGGSGMIADINVTPLVDITLVLLIIMMVAAPVIANNPSIKVELPKAASADETLKSTLSFTLTKADAVESAMLGAKARVRLRLERNLAFLGTLGANAPFIGLFGTVLGIIKAFKDLAGNQSGGIAIVMAGISEALVATAVGLMVAIPAVIGFNYFQGKVRKSLARVDAIAHLVLASFGESAESDAPAVRRAEAEG